MKWEMITRWLPSSLKDIPWVILLLCASQLPFRWSCYLLLGVFLHVAVCLAWCARGRRVLFVYSNSPDWQEYVEEKIIPKPPINAVIMNWSDRKNGTGYLLPCGYFTISAEMSAAILQL